MSRQEALQQFRQALKAGQKCYRDCVHRGRYPYPQVLEERLRGCAVAGRVDLGVLDIPIAQIIGTNTAGRQAAERATRSVGMRWCDACVIRKRMPICSGARIRSWSRR